MNELAHDQTALAAWDVRQRALAVEGGGLSGGTGTRAMLHVSQVARYDMPTLAHARNEFATDRGLGVSLAVTQGDLA